MAWFDLPGRTCIAAYRFKGAASEAASKVNLANPGTYNLVPVGANMGWTAADGWWGGQNGYFKYGAGLFPAHDWTYIMKVASAQSFSMQFGGSSGGTGLREQGMSFSNAGAYQDIFNWGSAAVGGVVVNATMAMAGKSYYIDGVLKGTISAGTGTCPYEFYLFTENWADLPHGSGEGNGCRWHAVAFYNSTLTQEEVVKITAEMEFPEIGNQVARISRRDLPIRHLGL